jgi:stage V sporulation protein G
MNINITEVEIAFIKPKNGVVGFASLLINNSIYLGSIAIHKKLNDDGYRLTYPTRKAAHEQSNHIFHPINKKTSNAIEQAIFAKLKNVMNKVNYSARYSSNNFGSKTVLD